jgi:flagellar protein FliO/FliZ
MKDILVLLLQISAFLPLVLGLIYLSLKFGGSRLQSLQNGKFIRVLERVALSKENSLMVVKLGEKGYVISSNNSKTEILQELSKEELLSLLEEKQIPQFDSFKDFYQKLNTRRKMKYEKKY